MKTYGQFCPVAKAAEIFAERWTPLIIRKMLMGSKKFSELESGMAHIPRSLLTQRLRKLEDAGVVVRKTEGSSKRAEYHLTEAGADLFDVVKGLGDWGHKWVNHDIGVQDVDPALLMWDMHCRVNLDVLPPERVVIQVTFHGAAKGDYWLVLERPEPSVCMRNPGLEVDLFINADTVAFHKVWMGMTSLAICIEDGLIDLGGLTSHVNAFPDWFKLSIFSDIEQAVISV
jgi:DNA-binding HxlR family transcriptional regulator